MAEVDHRSFQEKLFEFTGRNFDIVSTIDHPYASPPIRLVDGHYKLNKLNGNGPKPLLCIWDVNQPDINSYRYELGFDTGILAGKDRNFFIFSESHPYPLQRPKLIDFTELKKRVQLILGRLNFTPKELGTNKGRAFVKNLDEVIQIYLDTIKSSDNGTEFYRNLIEKFYILLGLDDLGRFVRNSFQPYFKSSIAQQWIPYCIQETKDEPYGFLNLLDKGLFRPPYFRNIEGDSNLLSIDEIKDNLEKILEKLTNSTLVPSYEIFFWTLFLADIKHFGNDYDFFHRLDEAAPREGFISKMEIQLTKHNEDSRNFVQFEKDRSFSCFLRDGEYVIRKNNPVKTSRILSLTSLYCHLGSGLGNLIRGILNNRGRSPEVIEMGKTIF